MSKKIIDFDGSWQNYKMTNGKFSCGFNMPNAIKGEGSHRLPPYAKRMPFLVDEYPACPNSWMKSEGRVKSFFVAVEEGKGMWLDLNDNANLDRHVAVVISIQGINPITGLPCKDAQLEQYIDSCPKHKKKFGPDRYCKECGFKWPKQNYLATTGTPNGAFWLDGFKAADGIVRQYILTAEKMRGVASNIIGEDRVYAVGLSFFLAKGKKPEDLVKTGTTRACWESYTISNHDLVMGDWNQDSHVLYDDSSRVLYDDSSTALYCCNISSSSASNHASNSSNSSEKKKMIKKGVGSVLRSVKSVSTKKLEVGAGANIYQAVHDDPENLDFWHNEPESIICINYAIEADVKKIIEAGYESIESHPEGFLQDVPVGN